MLKIKILSADNVWTLYLLFSDSLIKGKNLQNLWRRNSRNCRFLRIFTYTDDGLG